MSHSPQPPTDDTTLHDVKQLGMWSAIGSLGYIFWVVGGMEMVERLAYYGVRAVATIYATRPTSEGGLGVTMATFGWLLLCWNLAQSVIPVFTGGLSDRYGYKQTIFLSTAIKVSGYLWMAWFHSYGGFFVGCMLLAVGTAIFKPGIQGTLIKATNRRNSSMAWGIFYQTVNIGGWIGPLIALHMRSRIGWTYVFYTNAAFICLNFLWLLTYREPGRAERLARQQRWRTGAERPPSLAREAWHELRKPHLALYLLIFSVWWFMFPMLWDVLPKYIEDWVDTTVIVRALFGPEGTTNPVFQFLLGMDAAGLSIQPEGIVNLNAGMIMLTCFLFAAISAKMRATTSLVVGTVLIIGALVSFGWSCGAWVAVVAMVMFSAGEMLASPKFSEFLGNIAPSDKKAMWIGYSQAPILLGWTLEGKLGPQLYHLFSSKDEFARQMLMQHGFSAESVSELALPIGEAFQKLVEVTGQTPVALTQTLYESHAVGSTWFVFAGVGVVSAVMIHLYGRWIRTLADQKPNSTAPAEPA